MTRTIQLKKEPPADVAQMIYSAYSIPPSTEQAEALCAYAQMQAMFGKVEQAEAVYDCALNIALEAGGPDDPVVISIKKHYSVLLRNSGREKEADAMHRQVKAASGDKPGPN